MRVGGGLGREGAKIGAKKYHLWVMSENVRKDAKSTNPDIW